MKEELKKEIEHLKWYIEKQKLELKGPYNSARNKQIFRERKKDAEEKLKIAKAKLKGLK